MTNESQPDRQGGDGLRKPLERLLAAFKGMMPFPLVVQAVAEGLVRDAEAALVAVPQSTDAAEGARQEVQKSLDMISGAAADAAERDTAAPPKPAPDATMREALEECRPHIESFRWQGKRYQVLLAKIDAALSAPVLPMSEATKRELIGDLPAPVPPADGADAFKTCVTCEMRRTCSASKHCAGLSLAQHQDIYGISGAVAAEPVAWQPGQSIEDYAHNLLDREFTNDPAQPTVAALRAIGVALQGELKCIDALRAVWDDWIVANDESGMDEYEIKDVSPETVQKVQSALRGRLYATPPVRGDREALRELYAKTIYETGAEPDNDACTWDYAKRIIQMAKENYPDQAKMYQDEIDTAFARADAILSLPVRPGAGERDQELNLLRSQLASCHKEIFSLRESLLANSAGEKP